MKKTLTVYDKNSNLLLFNINFDQEDIVVGVLGDIIIKTTLDSYTHHFKLIKDTGIQKDDYIQGKEYHGHNIKEVLGWVDSVHYCEDGSQYFNIQADDQYRGARGTTIHSKLGEIKKLSPKERSKCIQ